MPYHHDPEAARRRAITLACAYTDTHYNEALGKVTTNAFLDVSERETVFGSVAYFASGEPERIARGNAILQRLGPVKDGFSLNAALVILLKLDDCLESDTRDILRQSIEDFIDVPAEDIIAGRNNNLPMQTWTVRIAAGHWFNEPDLVEGGIDALQRLTDMVADHGTIPEFNSPVYHSVMFQLLRTIQLIGEPQTSTLAERLERHLWNEIAWRFHPTLHVPAGPWSRIYHDGLVGGGTLLSFALDIRWGSFYDDSIPEKYDHGFELNCGGVVATYANDYPDVRAIALDKPLPVTVVARAEQVDYHVGTTWVPGGIAEITTWMDRNLAVGTATRPHGHGMQNASYLAQWTRTGEPISQLADLGHAFTRFIQNDRRPGTGGYKYRNHLNGYTMMMNKAYWADDGRPFAFQSGPTALVTYVPKGQERAYVKSLEAAVVVPRLNTVDTVLVDGDRVRGGHEACPSSSVVVRSGKVSLGLRFCAVDPTLYMPVIRVELSNDHLLVSLRLVDFDRERELPESEYRRYAASIGAELRFTPTEDEVQRLVNDMKLASLTDTWWMGNPPVNFGGPRMVCFRVAGKELRGRFAPVGETWLSRHAPAPEGHIERIIFQAN